MAKDPSTGSTLTHQPFQICTTVLLPLPKARIFSPLGPPPLIVMLVMALPDRAFAAVNVTSKVPAWPVLGVQVNEPEVFDPFAVKVAPVGRFAAVSDVIASPSASDAVTVNVSSVPSVPETVGGAVTTGA